MIGKITVVSLFLLLVWGNIVAGLKAGLGCPDWPLCHGRVLPPFRWDIYTEFTHRILGVVASVFLIILAYQRFRHYRDKSKFIPILIVILLLIQIALGGIVVLLELPVNLTTVHFANAILIYSLAFYMAFFDGEKREPVFSIRSYGMLFFLLGLMVFSQAVLGAYVRHSGAGLACPDFPKCLGFWIPPELSGMVLIHFSHRTFAYIIFIMVFVIFISTYLSSDLRRDRSRVLILLGLIAVQIMIGVGVIHSKLYFLTTALHLAVALLILSTVLYTWFQEMGENHV
jgi:cytochrome c oxidase assembly protein subunit 15